MATCSIQHSIRRTVDTLQETIGANSTRLNPTANLSFNPLDGRTFEGVNATSEHAKTAYLLGLKEIRKTLGDLPEFEGKGYEFLNFKMKFNAMREVGQFNDAQLINKLEKSLKGCALEHVRIWLFSPNPNPDTIMRDLEEKFYHPNLIIQEALQKIVSFDSMKRKDREQLEKFKRVVDAYIHVCITVKESIHLTGRVPSGIEDKLPDSLYEEWQKHVNIPVSTGNWSEFSIFLGNSVRFLKVRYQDPAEANPVKAKQINVAVGQQSIQESDDSLSRSSENSPTRNNLRAGEENENSGFKKEFSCNFDRCDKPIYRCEEFLTLDFDDKQKFCDDNSLCSRCLGEGHTIIQCARSDLPSCSTEGCVNPKGHTTVMHPPTCDKNDEEEGRLNLISKDKSNLFLVVPALVERKDGSKRKISLLIDTGSDTSLITQELFLDLGIEGTPCDFNVEWCAGGIHYESIASHKTELKLSPVDEPDKSHSLRNIFTMKDLILPKQGQNSQQLKKLFPHLKDIDIPEFDEHHPQMLLGLKHRHLTYASKVILPPVDGEAGVAELTLFGWAISAVMSSAMNSEEILSSIAANEENGAIKSGIKNTLDGCDDFVPFRMDITSRHYGDRHFWSSCDERMLEMRRKVIPPGDKEIPPGDKDIRPGDKEIQPGDDDGQPNLINSLEMQVRVTTRSDLRSPHTNDARRENKLILDSPQQQDYYDDGNESFQPKSSNAEEREKEKAKLGLRSVVVKKFSVSEEQLDENKNGSHMPPRMENDATQVLPRDDNSEEEKHLSEVT